MTHLYLEFVLKHTYFLLECNRRKRNWLTGRRRKNMFQVEAVVASKRVFFPLESVPIQTA